MMELGPQFGYRGQHQPSNDDAPIHDLTSIYPADVYTHPHYYGDARSRSWGVLASVKDRPNAMVTVYRAVPKQVGDTAWMAKDLDYYKKGMALWMGRGKLPAHPDYNIWRKSGSDFYNHAAKMVPKLEKQIAANPPQEIKTINPGDWVTLDREYAKNHGEGALNGNYRILSKAVPASHVRTPADSFDEAGYFPPEKGK